MCLCGSTCAQPLDSGTLLVVSALNDSTIAGLSFEDGDLVSYEPSSGKAMPILLENDIFGGVDED